MTSTLVSLFSTIIITKNNFIVKKARNCHTFEISQIISWLESLKVKYNLHLWFLPKIVMKLNNLIDKIQKDDTFNSHPSIIPYLVDGKN